MSNFCEVLTGLDMVTDTQRVTRYRCNFKDSALLYITQGKSWTPNANFFSAYSVILAASTL